MLGAAAGGGLPQWNCGCANCCQARLGQLKPLTQSSVAIQSGSNDWVLINASPDLPAQILACPELHPDSASLRGTPIAAVLLTNADLDHVMGLFSLREGGRLKIHATKAVRESLDAGLALTPCLDAFCGVDWVEPPEIEFAPLPGNKGSPSSLVYRAISLPGGPPIFARGNSPDGIHSVAYFFRDLMTDGQLLVAPDVAGWTDALNAAMAEADAILIDGTFWSDDELQRVKPAARTAAQMGHVTIRESSLARLSKLSARHRVYIHLNNTNPVLAPGSPERAAVEAAGIVVGYDGLQFEI